MKTDIAMQRRILRQYYVFSGLLSFCGLSFTSAIYASFLLKNGLNLFQANLVNVAFFLTLFACEIPTGAFADIFGRKASFALACMFIGIGKLLYGSMSGFWGFVLAEMVCAVGATFYSGAFMAWFVDSMKHAGNDGELRHEFATCTLVSQICAAMGAISGSYLFARGIALPWLVGSAMLFVLTLAVLATLREDYFVRTPVTVENGLVRMKDIAVKSIRYGVDNDAVRFVLLITCVQALGSMALNMYWQPFFGSHGVKEAHYGFLFSAMLAALAIGSFWARKLRKSSDERKAIVRLQVICGALVALAAVVPGLWPAIILFILHEVPRGIFNPLKDAYLQKRIPSDERATISSFCAIAPHIGGVVGLVISGAVAQWFGISAAWVLSGAIFVAGSILATKRIRD